MNNTTNHRVNQYPASCCTRHGDALHPEKGSSRVVATCCVDTVIEDKYHTMTITPRCYCREHCPVCGVNR